MPGTNAQPDVNAKRGLAVLGSTGSIGTQTLEIVRLFPDRFRVQALTARSNATLLAEQAREFRPDYVVIGTPEKRAVLEEALSGTGTEVLAGEAALQEVAALESVDVTVAAVVGFAGLRPVLAALKAGHTVALANKETMVVAGALVNEVLDRHDGTLLPVDSEHSAILQCLAGESERAVEELVLTASGGPFRTRPAHTFEQITRQEALDHPNWSMGEKITIDSATMMNKGLEVIEARWLFDLSPERIRVLVHPQSIVHSLVTFQDGATKAQLGVPDMKVPIQYALSYPERWPAPHERIDWTTLQGLDFALPDVEKFPCLQLAYDALEAGGTRPATLNAANEQAVALFLREQIGFTEIPALVEEAVACDDGPAQPGLDALIEADAAARRCVLERTGTAAN